MEESIKRYARDVSKVPWRLCVFNMMKTMTGKCGTLAPGLFMRTGIGMNGSDECATTGVPAELRGNQKMNGLSPSQLSMMASLPSSRSIYKSQGDHFQARKTTQMRTIINNFANRVGVE